MIKCDEIIRIEQKKIRMEQKKIRIEQRVYEH